MINPHAGLGHTEVAVAPARAGADVVRAMYGRTLTRVDKGAGDFATAADVEGEKTTLGVVHAAGPADAVLGEKGGQQGAAGAAPPGAGSPAPRPDRRAADSWWPPTTKPAGR